MSASWVDPLLRFHASYTEDDEGCYIWRERTDKDGYGRFYASAERYGTPDTDKAHRWIFEAMHGYAPPVVMHRCDKPACVNWVKCLRPGTEADNHADMIAKGRQGHGVTGGARGEAHHKSILTDSQVMEIRGELTFGILTHKMLAEVYGVSRSSVSSLASGSRRKLTQLTS